MLHKHISSGRWELSLLAWTWISQKIKQKDRRSVRHAWALQGGRQAVGIVSRFPWDTAAPRAGEEMGPSQPHLMLEEENRWSSEENLGQQSLDPVLLLCSPGVTRHWELLHQL